MKKKTIDFIKKHGIICGILTLCLCFFKKLIFAVLLITVGADGINWCCKEKEKIAEYGNKKRHKRERSKMIAQDKNRLLHQWECSWKQAPTGKLKYCSSCMDSESEYDKCFAHGECFRKMFLDNYRFIIFKGRENQKKNFYWKKIFVCILLLGFAGFAIQLYWELKKGTDVIPVFAKNSLLLIMLVWLCGTVAKWLDVKKYQETWARHSQHQYLLEREMLLFVNNMEPYNTVEKREIFVKKTIEIWDANQTKFVNNMEQKETTMMDVFKQAMEMMN